MNELDYALLARWVARTFRDEEQTGIIAKMYDFLVDGNLDLLDRGFPRIAEMAGIYSEVTV
jgi:hypothetical protein